MIRCYFLQTERIGNTDTVKGISYIHQAILTVEDSLRKLIQDTTTAEHLGLVAVCVSWRVATATEIAQLAALPPPPPPPSPDVLTLRAYLADPHSGLPDLEAAFQALARLSLR